MRWAGTDEEEKSSTGRVRGREEKTDAEGKLSLTPHKVTL